MDKSVTDILEGCQERLQRAAADLSQEITESSAGDSSLGVLSHVDDTLPGIQQSSGVGSSLGILSQLDESLAKAQNFIGTDSSLAVLSELDDSLIRTRDAVTSGGSIPAHVFPSPGPSVDAQKTPPKFTSPQRRTPSPPVKSPLSERIERFRFTPRVIGTYGPYLPRRIQRPEEPRLTPEQVKRERPTHADKWYPLATSTPVALNILDVEGLTEALTHPRLRPPQWETYHTIGSLHESQLPSTDPLERSMQAESMPSDVLDPQQLRRRRERERARGEEQPDVSIPPLFFLEPRIPPRYVQQPTGEAWVPPPVGTPSPVTSPLTERLERFYYTPRVMGYGPYLPRRILKPGEPPLPPEQHKKERPTHADKWFPLAASTPVKLGISEMDGLVETMEYPMYRPVEWDTYQTIDSLHESRLPRTGPLKTSVGRLVMLSHMLDEEQLKRRRARERDWPEPPDISIPPRLFHSPNVYLSPQAGPDVSIPSEFFPTPGGETYQRPPHYDDRPQELHISVPSAELTPPMYVSPGGDKRLGGTPAVLGTYTPYLPRRIPRPGDPEPTAEQLEVETPRRTEAWEPMAASSPVESHEDMVQYSGFFDEHGLPLVRPPQEATGYFEDPTVDMLEEPSLGVHDKVFEADTMEAADLSYPSAKLKYTKAYNEECIRQLVWAGKMKPPPPTPPSLIREKQELLELKYAYQKKMYEERKAMGLSDSFMARFFGYSLPSKPIVSPEKSSSPSSPPPPPSRHGPPSPQPLPWRVSSPSPPGQRYPSTEPTTSRSPPSPRPGSSRTYTQVAEKLPQLTAMLDTVDQLIEEVLQTPRVSPVVSPPRPIPVKRPTPERSPVDHPPSSERTPVVRPPTPERPPVVRRPTPERPPVGRPPTPERPPVIRPPTPERPPVVRPPTPERPPVVRRPTPERPRVVRPPTLERPPVVRPPTPERPPVVRPPTSDRSTRTAPPSVSTRVPTPKRPATVAAGTPRVHDKRVVSTPVPARSESDSLLRRVVVSSETAISVISFPSEPSITKPDGLDDSWSSLSPSPPPKKPVKRPVKHQFDTRLRPGLTTPRPHKTAHLTPKSEPPPSIHPAHPQPSTSAQIQPTPIAHLQPSTSAGQLLPQTFSTPAEQAQQSTSSVSITIGKTVSGSSICKTVRFSETVSERTILARDPFATVSELMSRYGTTGRPPRTASTYRPPPEEPYPEPRKLQPEPPREVMYGPQGPWVHGSTRRPPRTAAGRFDYPIPAPPPPRSAPTQPRSVSVTRPPTPARAQPPIHSRSESVPRRPLVLQIIPRTPQATPALPQTTPRARPVQDRARPMWAQDRPAPVRARPTSTQGRPVSAQTRLAPLGPRPASAQARPARVPDQQRPGRERPPQIIIIPDYGSNRPPPRTAAMARHAASDPRIPTRYSRDPQPDPTRSDHRGLETHDLERKVLDVDERIQRIESDLFSSPFIETDLDESVISPVEREKFQETFTKIKQGVSRLQDMIERRKMEVGWRKDMDHYSI